jgi:hypothetical protein
MSFATFKVSFAVPFPVFWRNIFLFVFQANPPCFLRGRPDANSYLNVSQLIVNWFKLLAITTRFNPKFNNHWLFRTNFIVIVFSFNVYNHFQLGNTKLQIPNNCSGLMQSIAPLCKLQETYHQYQSMMEDCLLQGLPLRIQGIILTIPNLHQKLRHQ